MPSVNNSVENVRKRRKGRSNVRIQVHVRFHVPDGYTLAEGLVRELIEDWIDNGEFPDEVGEIIRIDWEIEENNKARRNFALADRAEEVRQTLISRFRGFANIRVVQKLGPSSNEGESF